MILKKIEKPFTDKIRDLKRVKMKKTFYLKFKSFDLELPDNKSSIVISNDQCETGFEFVEEFECGWVDDEGEEFACKDDAPFGAKFITWWDGNDVSFEDCKNDMWCYREDFNKEIGRLIAVD